MSTRNQMYYITRNSVQCSETKKISLLKNSSYYLTEIDTSVNTILLFRIGRFVHCSTDVPRDSIRPPYSVKKLSICFLRELCKRQPEVSYSCSPPEGVRILVYLHLRFCPCLRTKRQLFNSSSNIC